MVFKFYNNMWHFHPDFCRYVYHIYSFKYQREIALTDHLDELFKKYSGSWTESKDIWIKFWTNYSNYYKSYVLWFPKDNNCKFHKYMSQSDYNKYIRYLNDVVRQIKFNDNLISNSTLKDYDLAAEYYRSVKYMVEYVHRYYDSLWIPLPGYEKPIKQYSSYDRLEAKRMKNIQSKIQLRKFKQVEDHWPSSFKTIPHFIRWDKKKGPIYWFEQIPVYESHYVSY